MQYLMDKEICFWYQHLIFCRIMAWRWRHFVCFYARCICLTGWLGVTHLHLSKVLVMMWMQRSFNEINSIPGLYLLATGKILLGYAYNWPGIMTGKKTAKNIILRIWMNSFFFSKAINYPFCYFKCLSPILQFCRLWRWTK